MTYTVYHRKPDGQGTITWANNLTKSEALAAQAWCFKNPAVGASIVWSLDDSGNLLDEPMLKEKVQ